MKHFVIEAFIWIDWASCLNSKQIYGLAVYASSVATDRSQIDFAIWWIVARLFLWNMNATGATDLFHMLAIGICVYE